MKELRNPFLTSSPENMIYRRTIPKDSKVKRRLIFDDEPEKNSGDKHNIVDSIDDVNRILAEEAIRSARKWNYDILNDEPIAGDVTWVWETENLPVENRKRKMEPETSQSTNEDGERKTRRICVLNDANTLDYIKAKAADDNTANSLMDDTRDCYAEGVQHWNFDFDNRKPFEGPVEWQQVGRHWVGNKAGTWSRLVLYPESQNQKEENAPTSQEEPTHKEPKEPNADEVNTTQAPIQNLLSEHVNVIYGDNKEMNIGFQAVAIKTTSRFIDADMLNNMYMLQEKVEHRQIKKDMALDLIHDDESTASADEANNSTPKKNLKIMPRMSGGSFLQLD